jgi:hypothetical protein
MRGYDYLSFLGNKGFFGNAELRFRSSKPPDPHGVVGGLRGVFFFNFGAAGYEGVETNAWTSATTIETPILDYAYDPFSPSQFVPVYGTPRPVSGFRLIDSRASYGVGLETFARLPHPLRLVVARSSTGTGRTSCSPARGRRRRGRSNARHLVPQ